MEELKKFTTAEQVQAYMNGYSKSNNEKEAQLKSEVIVAGENSISLPVVFKIMNTSVKPRHLKTASAFAGLERYLGKVTTE